MKPIAVLLADGFEEIEGITPIDFMRRAGIDVVTLGVGGKIIRGGHGIAVEADEKIEKANSQNFDGVVIPGGMPGAENVINSEAASSLITECYKAGKIVAAICAAPAVVLTPLGVLEGKRATCYPGFESRFENANVTFSAERVVKDGNIITSRGPGTAAEFAIELIREISGKDTAESIHGKTLQK